MTPDYTLDLTIKSLNLSHRLRTTGRRGHTNVVGGWLAVHSERVAWYLVAPVYEYHTSDLTIKKHKPQVTDGGQPACVSFTLRCSTCVVFVYTGKLVLSLISHHYIRSLID
jgi:hypothetical protein